MSWMPGYWTLTATTRPSFERGPVHLGERGRRDGCLGEVLEDVGEGPLELAFDGPLDGAEGTRRDLVLEAGEDVDVLVGDHVGAGADDLAELDEEALVGDGEVVEAAGGPGVMARAAGLGVAEAEAPLAEGDRLVADVDARGEVGDGEPAVGAVGESHGGIVRVRGSGGQRVKGA